MYRSSRFTYPTRTTDRRPAILTASVAIILAAGVACYVGGDKKKDTTVSTTSPTTTQPTIAGEVTQSAQLVVPQNVTFASAHEAYTGRRFREAAAAFEVYVDKHPNNALGHYMLGLSAWKSGDLKRADAAFDRALEIEPRNVKTLLNSSRVLLELGTTDDALTRVGAAIEIDSGSAESHRMMGRVRSARGERDSAIVSYRVGLSLDPADSWSMNNVGLLLIEQGRYDEAIPPLARAVELRPNAPAFSNNLGIALERTGHFAAAAAAYRGALAVDSTYTKASRSLSRVVGKNDDPSTPVVDVTEAAAKFNDELQAARQQRMLAKAVVKPE